MADSNNYMFRQKAEDLLKSINIDEKSISDIKTLIYELQVYQIELELQNEELRKAQLEIEDSKNRYADLYDFAPVGYFTLDQEGIIADVNLTGANMLGIERKFLKKLPLIAFIAHEYQEKFYYHRKSVFDSGRIQTCELKLKKKDGTGFYVQIESILVPGKETHSKQMRSVIVDITQRIELEKNLALEQEKLSVTLDSIADSIISTDTSGNIILFNHSAEKLFGIREPDVLGKTLSELITFFERVKLSVENNGSEPELKPLVFADIFRAIQNDENGKKNLRNIIVYDRNHSERTINLSFCLIRDRFSNSSGMVIAIQDITESNKIEAELQKIRNLEAIGFLAGGIAHDFRNILSGIASKVSLARVQTDPDNVIYKQLLQAEKGCERATEITGQLMTFAKGGAPVKKVSSIVNVIKDTVDFTLHGSKVKCTYEMENDLKAIEIDEGQISQVINNLILNAVQAMPDGGEIKIKCGREEIEENNDFFLLPGEYINILIQDNGAGIPAENLEKIFDPYFSTKKEGTGLGLSLSYSIIKKHGGTITVSSERNKGTSFKIYLPANASKDIEPDAPDSDVIQGSGRILVMDDDPVLLESICDMLMFLGYDHISCKDGESAIELYQSFFEKNEPFDAVLLDLTIKGKKGGKETIEELLMIDPDITAIVASGYSDDPIVSRFRDFGFKGCMVKPFAIEKLSETLNNVLVKRNG